jgi:hypothetical protein
LHPPHFAAVVGVLHAPQMFVGFGMGKEVDGEFWLILLNDE